MLAFVVLIVLVVTVLIGQFLEAHDRDSRRPPGGDDTIFGREWPTVPDRRPALRRRDGVNDR
jgi:hypothetical protein